MHTETEVNKDVTGGQILRQRQRETGGIKGSFETKTERHIRRQTCKDREGEIGEHIQCQRR